MKIKIIIAVIVVILFGGAGFYFWHHHKNLRTHALTHSRTSLYHCPMHPAYTSDKPGQCPICGMDLVPVEEEKGDSPHSEGGLSPFSDRADVTISLERQQLIGVKTAEVKMGNAIKEIHTVATAAFNPDLAIAQREYLEAKKIGDTSLIDASRDHLIHLGMNEQEIKELKNVQKGLYLPNHGSWIYPVIYEYELPYVKIGQNVIIKLNDGTETNGTVRSIDSVIDPATRSARLHVEVKDKGINPSAFGSAEVMIELGEKLLVPKSAVITTGERNIVFMVHDGTHFMPMDIKLGAELDDDYVVEGGLNVGDVVAVSANFLIDSESRLKAAIH